MGVILALVWTFTGSFVAPGHDAYGKVSIPGERIVSLPAGPARLYVEEHGYFTDHDNEGADVPSGVAASIEPVDGGSPVTFHSMSGTSVVTVNDTSWVVLASFDAPSEGAYRVQVIDPQNSADANYTVTIGKGPWSPVAPWVFGIGIVVAAAMIGFVADRVRLILVRRRSA